MKKGDYVALKESVLETLDLTKNSFWRSLSKDPRPIENVTRNDSKSTNMYNLCGLWFKEEELTLFPKEDYPELYL